MPREVGWSLMKGELRRGRPCARELAEGRRRAKRRLEKGGGLGQPLVAAFGGPMGGWICWLGVEERVLEGRAGWEWTRGRLILCWKYWKRHVGMR